MHKSLWIGLAGIFFTGCLGSTSAQLHCGRFVLAAAGLVPGGVLCNFVGAPRGGGELGGGAGSRPAPNEGQGFCVR